MSKEQVIDYVMTTPGNPNRAVLNGMLDSLASGSGSSDFSTAKVTIVNDVNSHITFHAPVVYADETSVFATGGFSVMPNSTTVADVILYKGDARIPDIQYFEVSTASISASGNITVGAYGLITITGDGTLTITVDEEE